MPKADDYQPFPLAEHVDEMYIVSVLLLCVECKQAIKATINSPQWLRAEWIGPSGECQSCNQLEKREREVGDGA